MPQPAHETDFEEGHGTSGLGQKIGFVLGLLVAGVMPPVVLHCAGLRH